MDIMDFIYIYEKITDVSGTFISILASPHF